MEIIQTVVKFMVAQITYGVIEGIHRGEHRVNIAVLQALRRHVIAQWAALNQIAVIHQHAVGGLAARGVNQRGGAHQAKFFRRGIFVIVEIHHIAVQIGGFENS